MRRWAAAVVLMLMVAVPALGRRKDKPEPEHEAHVLLRRAYDLTDIRAPGSVPFTMKVTFHGYPGIDFAKKHQPGIITGDGSYEETWISPHKWRREITYPGYHAVEVFSDGVRKYQASSDYEPSRVLMMLTALFYPIPRNLVSPEFGAYHRSWNVKHLVAGTLPYVKLTYMRRGANNDWFYYIYALMPDGIPVQSNYLGMVTNWDRDSRFGGKIVPLHFYIQALGHTLLDARVTIGAAGKVDPKRFEIAGPPARPGMTMRPIPTFELKLAWPVNPVSIELPSDANPPNHSGREIIDRNGRVREVELIDAPDPRATVNSIRGDRFTRFYPAKLDGSRCEETYWTRE